MKANNVQIFEQEDGTYVMPDQSKYEMSWALYVFDDGSAELFTKRSPTGALLGKPIKISAPERKIKTLDMLMALCDNPEDLETLMQNSVGRHFKVVFSK